MIDLKERFDYFNQIIFGGELPKIPIIVGNAKSYLGRLEYRKTRRTGLNPFARKPKYEDVRLRISNWCVLTDDMVEDVLIHEMIHLYILVKDINDTSAHGKVFRKMMGEINTKFGRNIRISHKGAEQKPRTTAVRMRCVGLSLLETGKYGVTVCTEASAGKIAALLPRRYKIMFTKWYKSNHPFFAHYPLSCRGTIYKITTENAEYILSGEFEKLKS